MNILERPLIKALGSLRLSLWLLSAQLALFLAGAIAMPRLEAFKSINSMPLMRWMREEAPISASWWLWASVALLCMLAMNTLICSAASIARRKQGRPWLSVLAPQVIHLGFLLMMFGHLVSSVGAVHNTHSMAQGSALRLPDGNIMRLAKVDLTISPMGYPTDWAARIEYYSPEGKMLGRGVAAPNKPSFRDGTGVYIKQAGKGGALMEVHREPGTPWALGGGALFMLGTLALIGLKMRREK